MTTNTTLFDQKEARWVKHKKVIEWAEKLGGPINWVGQTPNWVGRSAAEEQNRRVTSLKTKTFF